MPRITDDERLLLAGTFAQRVQEADTLDSVKDVFMQFYLHLGWKALCRMWVKGESPELAIAGKAARRDMVREEV